jgi:hypothetical protein
MEPTNTPQEMLRTESLAQCLHRMQQVAPLLTSSYQMHLEKMLDAGTGRAVAEAVRSLFYAETAKPSVSDYFRSILRSNSALKQCETCFKKALKLRCGRPCAEKYSLRDSAQHNWPRF